MSAALKRQTIHAIRPEAVVRPPVGAPGVVLGGKYRLEAAIARGGMARVWRAKHVTLNRPVAVKFVDGIGTTAETRVATFLREATVAASVRHKNVVDMIDFGVVETNGAREPYMVMELLDGETLDQRMTQGPLSMDETTDITLQILSGLDAVHRAGIVHRDLKPGNVFLTTDQDGVFARLLDFGISQGADEIVSGTRAVVGTPEYMSPEQAFGDVLDVRSDIFSLGVVMYEMLAGILPFEGDSPQAVVELVASATPLALRELRPDIPELCAVVERAMSRELSARWSNVGDMRAALLDATGRGPRTSSPRLIAPLRESGSGTIAAPGAATLDADTLEPMRRTSSGGDAPTPRRYGLALVAVLVAIGAAAMIWWSLHDAPPRVAEHPAEHPAEPSERVVPPSSTPMPTADAIEAPVVVPAPAVPDMPVPARPTRARPRAARSQAPRQVVRELDF